MLHDEKSCFVCHAVSDGVVEWDSFDQYGHYKYPGRWGGKGFLTIALGSLSYGDDTLSYPSYTIEIHRLDAQDVINVLYHAEQQFGRLVAAEYLALIRYPNVAVIYYDDGSIESEWLTDREVDDAVEEYASYCERMEEAG